MSRESKIAVLKSVLARVQSRANGARKPRLVPVAAAPDAVQDAAAPEQVEPPELIPIEPLPEEAYASAEVVSEEPKVAAPVPRESLPPWPDPDEIEAPEPLSSPRLRETVEQQRAESAEAQEPEEPITLPPVSGRQQVDGVAADEAITIPPVALPPVRALDLDIAAPEPRPASAPPAPAKLVPLELVESAEPPAVETTVPAVSLLVEPGPSAPGGRPQPAVAVQVRAEIIGPAPRAAANVAAFEGDAKRFAPTSIGELIDASLGLGR
jgi:hypothetical protein